MDFNKHSGAFEHRTSRIQEPLTLQQLVAEAIEAGYSDDDMTSIREAARTQIKREL